jgi:hypothetical protein
MLTDTQVQQAKARSTPYKLADQGGLYLYVYTTGGRSWRYDYRVQGKQGTLIIGLYPEVSLAEARERHAEARELVARDVSTAKEKAIRRRAEREAVREAKEARTREWASRLKPDTRIAAFAEKKITEFTAAEGVIFVNVLADIFADRFISRLEGSSAVARAPSGEESGDER